MMPSQISGQIAADRLSWVDRMLETIRELPLDDRDAFFADERNIWTADSCLRRALEALFDLGRHILSRGFGEAPSEYKEVATLLGKYDVSSPLRPRFLEFWRVIVIDWFIFITKSTHKSCSTFALVT